MSRWAQQKYIYIAENGVSLDRLEFARDRSPLRVAFVGRLVPYKGADMLLESSCLFCQEGAARVAHYW